MLFMTLELIVQGEREFFRGRKTQVSLEPVSWIQRVQISASKGKDQFCSLEAASESLTSIWNVVPRGAEPLCVSGTCFPSPSGPQRSLLSSRMWSGICSWYSTVVDFPWNVKCRFPECQKGNLNVKTFVIA